jgi:hypothetical protein
MPHYTGTVSRLVQQPWVAEASAAGRVFGEGLNLPLPPSTAPSAHEPTRPMASLTHHAISALSHQPAFPPLRAGSHRAAEWGRERWKSGRVVATIREIGRRSEAARPDSVGFFSRLRAGKAVATCDGRHRLQPAFEIPCARADIFGGQTAHAEGSWSANSPQARWQQWRGLS